MTDKMSYVSYIEESKKNVGLFALECIVPRTPFIAAVTASVSWYVYDWADWNAPTILQGALGDLIRRITSIFYTSQSSGFSDFFSSLLAPKTMKAYRTPLANAITITAAIITSLVLNLLHRLYKGEVKKSKKVRAIKTIGKIDNTIPKKINDTSQKEAKEVKDSTLPAKLQSVSLNVGTELEPQATKTKASVDALFDDEPSCCVCLSAPFRWVFSWCH